MIELLGELGSSFPWIYRGWLSLLSGTYREDMKLHWASKGKRYSFLDKLMTLVFMLAEIALVVFIFIHLRAK